jgi:hypothetical protein
MMSNGIKITTKIGMTRHRKNLVVRYRKPTEISNNPRGDRPDAILRQTESELAAVMTIQMKAHHPAAAVPGLTTIHLVRWWQVGRKSARMKGQPPVM